MPTINIIEGSAASLDAITAMVNVALIRLGANTISGIGDGSPNALKATAVWEFVRDEVLQQRDWRFAKIRYLMTVSLTEPLYGYRFAYPMPTDFLRLVKWRGPMMKATNPAANPPGGYGFVTDSGIVGRYNPDPPVYPSGLAYIIESLPDGTLALFTDYDNTGNDLFINYIKKVTDATKYTPTFKSCVIYRLAEELATAITENQVKSRDMAIKYREYLNSAEAVNESWDFIDGETGSSAWEDAGR